MSPTAVRGAPPRTAATISSPAARGPVRVLFMVNALHVGGAEKHAIALLNGLDPEHFRLSALWLKPDESLLPQLDTARLRSAGCLNVTRKLDWQAVRTLQARLDAEDIEVIVCANEYPALYAWLASLRARRRPRLVEVFHTTEYARLKDRLQMLFYRRVLRSFDLLVYVSENQRQYWRRKRLAAARDVTIHNGIDCSHFDFTPRAGARRALRAQWGFGPDDYVIALCAALRPEKAHGDLLRALAALRPSLPTVRALLIGDGPERPHIETQIRQLELHDIVRITGFEQDVRPLLAASDVAVLTSHKVETFSIAVLEAMALGLAVVMTRVGGASEQIAPGEQGFLYAPGDIPALGRHLRALADAPLRRAMGARAARRVREEFSDVRMFERYDEEFRRLAGADVAAG